MQDTSELLTIKQASEWASQYLRREVTPSNIAYLVQYGRIKKLGNNGSTRVSKDDLIDYYRSYGGNKETAWTHKLGSDLNWTLSFDYLKESERTKHVHRLHPYKGKFIPQLVEYFLDSHIDHFKAESYFRKGDVVLDPFCGSGTTLVQANELGMHAIGIDISSFNALISNVKTSEYDLPALYAEVHRINSSLSEFVSHSGIAVFEEKLLQTLADFNNSYFPSPGFKVKLRSGEINEDEYAEIKNREFKQIFEALLLIYSIDTRQEKIGEDFLDKWYLKPVRREIDFVYSLVQQVKDIKIKNILTIILSRTIRSCRATTHSDLATLIEPVMSTYYCQKHSKICRPLFSMQSWWTRYCKDTISRLAQFDRLRTDTNQICLTGDSKSMNIIEALKAKQPSLVPIVKEQKIQGIFSSPPYVGLIDYHDQHAYAYDLFQFERRDQLEIGKMSLGQGQEARRLYAHSISEVLKNCKKFLADNYNVFLVANDKFRLYPSIAESAGMQIVKQYTRPVLCRTEKDKAAYSETIFHLKEA